MNLLNIKKLAATIAVACSLAFASTASALSLTVGDPFYYLGSITDGIPASQANETAWVNALTTQALGTTASFGDESLFRSTNNFGVLPSTLTLAFAKDEAASLTNPFNLSSGSLYVLGKYGAAAGQQISYVWYVGGLAAGTEIGLPSGALSHISVWSGTPTNVPDSGATVALIALGLVGLGLVGRRKA